MAKGAFLLALMLGKVASDSQPMGTCMYDFLDAADDLLDAGESIASAVTSCQKGGMACATDLLEATSGLIEGAASSLDVAGCFPGTPDLECVTDALDISGSALGVSAKIKDLAGGVCKAGGGDGRRLESDKSKTLECAAASAKVLLPITQLGLFFTFEVKKCADLKAAGDPGMKAACIDTSLELVATALSLAGDINDIIDACGHNDDFPADCIGAIVGLVEESTGLTNTAIGLANGACKPDDGRLRLYQKGIGWAKMLQRTPQVQLQSLPWFISGLLVLMMPLVYRAGKVRQARVAQNLETSLDSGLE